MNTVTTDEEYNPHLARCVEILETAFEQAMAVDDPVLGLSTTGHDNTSIETMWDLYRCLHELFEDTERDAVLQSIRGNEDTSPYSYCKEKLDGLFARLNEADKAEFNKLLRWRRIAVWIDCRVHEAVVDHMKGILGRAVQ